jgi:ABC-type branched-subunit amino acid transport system substrate-binding protein
VQTEIEASVEDGSWEYYSESPSIIESWLESYDKPKVNISLVLPFKANGKSAARNNMDFYSGALLAAREITDSNIALQLNVVDIANDSIAIDIAALKESDVVIGPISTKDIAKIQKVVYGNCPIVSPLDQRVESLTQQYSGLIQAPTSQSAQFNDLANWIMEDMTAEDKLVIIYEKGGRQNDNGRAIMGVINARGIPHTPFSYSILEGRNIQSVLESNMTATGVNRVIIASESEAFVNDAVRNLNLIVHNKFNVVLYAPSKIRTFETIEIENLHNTSLHTSLSYNIDYDEENTRTFLARYRAMFGTEPTQFAFQGYDLTKYFAEIIAKYQENWVSYLKDTDGEMLQSSIMFKQTESGSYVNQGIRRIIYGPGYSIRAVKTSHSQQPVE